MASALAERVDLELAGMTCAGCATRIERTLNKLDGVEATVNYATEGAAVRFDPGRIGVEKVIAAVEAIGYGAALPRDCDGRHAGRRRRERGPLVAPDDCSSPRCSARR